MQFSIDSAAPYIDSKEPASPWNFDTSLTVRVHCYALLVGFPLIVIFGTGLNTVCIVVMLRKSVFPASASVFMLWITFNDVLALVVKGSTHYLEELANYNISWWPYTRGALKHSSQAACGTYVAVTYYFLTGCPFYLAGLTLQRALYTLCPVRRPSLRASVATIVGFTAVALTFPVFRVLLSEYKAGEPAPCRLRNITLLETQAFYYYHTVLSNLCVFVVLLLGTICITGVIHCRSRGHHSSQACTAQRVSRTLLLMNCSFLVTFLPVGIYQLYAVSNKTDPTFRRLLFSCLNSLMYLNFACNGLSYLASQRFRACARQCLRLGGWQLSSVPAVLRKRSPVVHTEVSARCSKHCPAQSE